MAELKFDPNIMAARRYKGGLSQRDMEDQGEPARIYKLSSNENPLGPSPAIIECIRKHAKTLGEYSPVHDERLRVALARSYGRQLSPDHFVTANGAFEILEMIARGFVRPGDPCIICMPTFGVYARTAGIQGARMVDAPLQPERFSHDVEGILSAVDESTRVLYLCNPNNPSGAIMTAEEMDELVAKMPAHVLIVADEVYHHFVERSDFPDSISNVLAEKNLIIVRSFSKAYGLAGMRIGYGITTPAIADYLSRLRRTFHLNTLALEAAIVALDDQDHVDKSVKLIRQERAWIFDQLTNLGLKVWPTQTNFVLFRPPVPAETLFERLLDFGVIVRPATMFGRSDCVRVTVGLPEANQAFINALAEVLAED
jgi:histidinol-phosphate aminotransferase